MELQVTLDHYPPSPSPMFLQAKKMLYKKVRVVFRAGNGKIRIRIGLACHVGRKLRIQGEKIPSHIPLKSIISMEVIQ
jgi:hypothetical protein